MLTLLSGSTQHAHSSQNDHIVYAGTDGGGVFKTVDGGETGELTWFDRQGDTLRPWTLAIQRHLRRNLARSL